MSRAELQAYQIAPREWMLSDTRTNARDRPLKKTIQAVKKAENTSGLIDYHHQSKSGKVKKSATRNDDAATRSHASSVSNAQHQEAIKLRNQVLKITPKGNGWNHMKAPKRFTLNAVTEKQLKDLVSETSNKAIQNRKLHVLRKKGDKTQIKAQIIKNRHKGITTRNKLDPRDVYEILPPAQNWWVNTDFNVPEDKRGQKGERVRKDVIEGYH